MSEKFALTKDENKFIVVKGNKPPLSQETIDVIRESLTKYSTYLTQRSGRRIDVTRFKQAQQEFTAAYGEVK